MIEAQWALKAGERDLFLFKIGFARGQLLKILSRFQRVEEEAPPSFICPGCGAVSYNPSDIESRYCGRCHQFGDDDAP